MRTLVYQKKNLNVKTYLQPDGTFSPDKCTAREFKGQFWIELLKILLQLIQIFGTGKFVKK